MDNSNQNTESHRYSGACPDRARHVRHRQLRGRFRLPRCKALRLDDGSHCRRRHLYAFMQTPGHILSGWLLGKIGAKKTLILGCILLGLQGFVQAVWAWFSLSWASARA